MIDVLANASTSAAQRFANHPLEEAKVRDTLGEIYDHLTRWPEAKAEYQKALALWQEHVGNDDPRALTSELMFAVMSLQLQQAYEAEPVLAGLVPRLERVFGADDKKTLDARRATATAHLQRGRMDEAERILLELRAHPSLLDDDGVQIKILQGFVSVNRHRANTEDLVQRQVIADRAEPLARECVDRLQRSEGPQSPGTLNAQASMAIVLWQQGKYRAAADTCQAVLDRSLNSLGECHFVRMQAMGTLALALNGLGEEDEPAELYLRKIQCMRQHNPPGSPQLLSDLFDALRFLDRAGRADEGEALARELTAALMQLGGPHGDLVFDSELYIARFVSAQDRLDEAEPIFQSLISREALADRVARARLHLFYAGHLVSRGRFEQAEQELFIAAELVTDLRKGTWETHPDDIIIGFIELYEAWGNADKAEEYRRLRAEVTPSSDG